MKRPRAAPHERTKAAARVLSPDQQWAANIRDRILADCHPYQRAAVLDPSRRVSILAGRGGAKTTTMRARAVLKMVARRRAICLFFGRTDEHALELQWEPLQEMNEFYGLEMKFNLSKLTATCTRTGSRYILSGMDTDRSIEIHRGKSRDEVQVDESASQDDRRLEKMITQVIGPRLGDRDGCIVIGGTPGHELRGTFYAATRPGSPDHAPYKNIGQEGYRPAYWSSHHWTLRDVVQLPDAERLYPALCKLWREALIEKEARGWSDDNPIWLREYLAIWASDDTDRVYRYSTIHNQWDPFDGVTPQGIAEQVRASVRRLNEMGLRDLHFVVPADSGHADPFALNPIAFSPTDPQRRMFHVGSFERTGMYAKTMAEQIVGADAVARSMRGEPLEPLGGVLGVTGWPDAMVLDSDGGTVDELKNVYGLQFKRADRDRNAKKSGIEEVNGEFHERRLFVLARSPMEDQLLGLQWREDANGQLKEDPRQANHSTDCLTYGRKEVALLFESGVVDRPPDNASAGRTMPAYEPPPDVGGDEYSDLLSPTEYVSAWG